MAHKLTPNPPEPPGPKLPDQSGPSDHELVRTPQGIESRETPGTERRDGEGKVPKEEVETATPPEGKEDASPKEYRVIAPQGFWDGVKLHSKGSRIRYAGDVKEHSRSLEEIKDSDK